MVKYILILSHLLIGGIGWWIGGVSGFQMAVWSIRKRVNAHLIEHQNNLTSGGCAVSLAHRIGVTDKKKRQHIRDAMSDCHLHGAIQLMDKIQVVWRGERK